MNKPGKDHLFKIWHLIDRRNRELGLSRYDWRDLMSQPLFLRLSESKLGQILAKVLRGPELLAPIMWRRIFRVPKYQIPSVFYHLGLSYLDMAELPWDTGVVFTDVDEVCRQALACRLEAEHVCWAHPHAAHYGPWLKGAADCGIPASCAHHTARLGIMLLQAGRSQGREDLVDAGVSAARALMEYHRWQHHDDGTVTVSYYPFSTDETINTGADAAALFAAVPPAKRPPLMQERLEGMVRMVVSEQQPDGSWFYSTRRHYRSFGGVPYVDNHHTAMVIGALAQILLSNSLKPELFNKAQNALEEGLRFYLERLFLPDGTGLYFPNRRRRTGVVGYSEGIAALGWCLQESSLISPKLAALASDMLSKMLDKAIRGFLDFKTGDVACYRFCGRPVNLQSARWGSAPLMQAVSNYLTWAAKHQI